MNRQDVEMFLGSMRGMGESFAQQNQREIENELKQKQLEAEMGRYKKATEHETRMEGKQDNMAEAQKAAAIDKDEQATFQALTELNASGQLDEGSRSKVNAWLNNHPKWGKIGIALQTPAQKPPPQSGQSSVAKALETADTFAAKAESETDPAKKAKYLDSEMILRDTARKSAGIDTSDTITEEVPAETDQPAVEAKPAVSHMFRADEPAVTAKPAVVGHPAYKRTYKVPHGAATTPDPGAKPITDRSGRKWLYRGSMADPTQDKNPANWQAQ